jgi:hypothetical protein
VSLWTRPQEQQEMVSRREGGMEIHSPSGVGRKVMVVTIRCGFLAPRAKSLRFSDLKSGNRLLMEGLEDL